MWDNTEAANSTAEQDERYPYFPVETGNPVFAAMSVLIVLGLIGALFLVTP